MGLLRAIIRVALFSVWTVLLVVVQMVYARTQKCIGRTPERQSLIVTLWYRGVVKILGIHIHLTDMSQRDPQTQYLYLANHSSYLDIIILGACMPPFFVAKADTEHWPLFGFLVKLGGTLFISRQRATLKAQMDKLRIALRQGKHLFLFPEGTTSDGLRILPFKSSLLNILYDADMPPVKVVPVCVAYRSLNGQIFSDDNKDMVAWYRDMTFTPHVWQFFQQKSLQVDMTLLPVIDPVQYTDAKKLTSVCEETITHVFAQVHPVIVHTVAE